MAEYKVTSNPDEKTISCPDGYTGKFVITTVAMTAMGMFSSTARGVGLSARSAADNQQISEWWRKDSPMAPCGCP